LNVTNSNFWSSATEMRGSAVFMAASPYGPHYMSFKGCRFWNLVAGRSGGAIYDHDGSGDIPFLTVDGCHFWNITSGMNGGAIHSTYYAAVADSTFELCNAGVSCNTMYGKTLTIH